MRGDSNVTDHVGRTGALRGNNNVKNNNIVILTASLTIWTMLTGYGRVNIIHERKYWKRDDTEKQRAKRQTACKLRQRTRWHEGVSDTFSVGPSRTVRTSERQCCQKSFIALPCYVIRVYTMYDKIVFDNRDQNAYRMSLKNPSVK